MMPGARYARLAALAGSVARAVGGAIDVTEIAIVDRKRGRANFATAADHAAQEAIVARLAAHDRTVPVLAEEGLLKKTDLADRMWVVDPIDGTLNFSRGLAHYAIAIGYVEDGRVRAAAVHAPALRETFIASERNGATLNGAPIRVSGTRRLTQALGVGSLGFRGLSRKDSRTRALGARLGGMRDIGSAALSITYTAAARFDIFIHEFLSPWDIAGPQLVAREAGACVISLRTGEDAAWDERAVVIGRPGLVREALRTIPELVRAK